MIKILRCAFLLCLLSVSTIGYARQTEIKLWPGVAPGSEKWTQKEAIWKDEKGEVRLRNITTPSITVFLPRNSTANGSAVVIAEGGGMLFLAWESGIGVAKWFAAHGTTAFVLKYRLQETPVNQQDFFDMLSGRESSTAGEKNWPARVQNIDDLATADALQAIRLVRKHASEWGVAPNRIGLMGFSAGAMITTNVLTSYDAESRPNFAASIYGFPVDGAKIPADAPPLFILCADDDPLVPATNSADLYSAWKDTGHAAELHIYSAGGHGFGVEKRGLPIDHWIDRFYDWMRQQGFCSAPSVPHLGSQNRGNRGITT